DLRWLVPDDAHTAATFARLRIAADAADAATPTGLTIGGEVEDHALDVVVPPLAISKTTSATVETRPGDVVAHQVTVENTARGQTTPPPTMKVVDDMADVLDGSDYSGDARDDLAGLDPASKFAFDAAAQTLTCVPNQSGAGATPGCEAPPDRATGERCASVTQGVPRLEVAKKAEAPAEPRPGDTLKSTVTATNTAANPARLYDSPSGVLQDAAYNHDAAANQAGALAWDPASSLLTWSGPLLRLVKSVRFADGVKDPVLGDTVFYEVIATNVGREDYAEAVFRDDVEDLLGNADFDQDSLVVVAGGGQAAYHDAAARIEWRGPIKAGASVRIAYSVTLTSGVNPTARNVVWQPLDPEDPAAPAPACADVKDGLDAVSGEPCAAVEVAVPLLEFVKRVEAPDPLGPGSVITYATRVTDVGTGGVVGRTEPFVSWTGPIPAGSHVDISFKVKLKAGGAPRVRNVIWQPENRFDTRPKAPLCGDGVHDYSGADSETGEPCGRAVVERAAVRIDKAVDAPDFPRTGDVITYTVTATNVGAAPYTEAQPVIVRDDLSDVLASSTWDNSARASSNPAPVFDADAGLLTWAGPLPARGAVSIAYTVTLVGGGDGVLVNVAWNALTPGDETPPTDCSAGGTSHEKQVTCSEAELERGVLSVRGRLAADASADVEYTVRVHGRGDRALGNFLLDRLPDGSAPRIPDRSECAEASPHAGNCVVIRVADASGGGGSDGGGKADPAGTLARTGATLGGLSGLFVAAFLVAAGTALVVASRRASRRRRV
ncbi:MAG: DUF11 domain-containing protein, partial [Bifidobacteriaceae bacterium]|nr:DUF11 domain-containing protein [Bifidobacteriaceae bacterium]